MGYNQQDVALLAKNVAERKNDFPGRNPKVNLEKKDVLHVARLAGLALTHEEAERMTGEIASILGYVEALGTVAVAESVTASPDTGGRPPARDLSAPFSRVGEALALAPDSGGGFFRVPRILEEGR